MRTPEEIKEGLYCCYIHSDERKCGECPYIIDDVNDCDCTPGKDAFEYIQQLEHQIGELTEKVEQLDHVTRERDALLEIVKELGECNYCKHNSYCPHTIPDCMNCKDGNCQCYSCGHQSKWQWSGVQEVE